MTTDINEIIKYRRSVYPKSYIDKPIEREMIEQILANADMAPTHKLTQPWRFKVFHSSDARQALSDYLGDYYTQHNGGEAFSVLKYNKTKESPLQSACVIAICMERNESVPEFEEIAAIGCAVQNMWLTCTAHGIGAYWSTPKSILTADAFLALNEQERCLGLFYMGYHVLPPMEGKRTPIETKVTWR